MGLGGHSVSPSPIDVETWDLNGVIADGLGSPLSPELVPAPPAAPSQQYSLWDGAAVALPPAPGVVVGSSVGSSPGVSNTWAVGPGGLGGGIWDPPAPPKSPW